MVLSERSAGRSGSVVELVEGITFAAGGGRGARAGEFGFLLGEVVFALGGGTLGGNFGFAVEAFEFGLAGAAGRDELFGGGNDDGAAGGDVAGAVEEGVDDVRVVNGEADPFFVGDAAVAVGVGEVEEFAAGGVGEFDVVAEEGGAKVGVEDVALGAGVELIEDSAELFAHGGGDAGVGGDAAGRTSSGGDGDGVAGDGDGALEVDVPDGFGLEGVDLAAVGELGGGVEVNPAEEDVVVDLEGLDAEGNIRVAGGASGASSDVVLVFGGGDEFRDGGAGDELKTSVVLATIDVRGNGDEEDHCFLYYKTWFCFR